MIDRTIKGIIFTYGINLFISFLFQNVMPEGGITALVVAMFIALVITTTALLLIYFTKFICDRFVMKVNTNRLATRIIFVVPLMLWGGY